MADRFFSKILETSEQLATRLEEGLTGVFQTTAEQQPLNTEKGSANAEFEENVKDDDDLAGYNPLGDIAEGVMGDIVNNQIQPTSPWEHVQAFYHAITWKEPFILGLLCFQAVIFISACLVSRRNVRLTPRIVLMIIIAVCVKMSERLNKWGAKNWQQFSKQDYFDRHGLFVSIMWSGPLLIDSLIMMLSFLYEASQLLVQVKAQQITKERKKKAGDASKQTKSSNGSDGDKVRRRKKEA